MIIHWSITPYHKWVKWAIYFYQGHYATKAYIDFTLWYGLLVEIKICIYYSVYSLNAIDANVTLVENGYSS